MTEDSFPRVSSSETASSTDPSTVKQRKKRKWDQPAEPLVSAGGCQPAVLPFSNIGSFVGIMPPGIVPVCGTLLAAPLTSNGVTSVQQHAVALAQKLNQPKIQDELIAREIVINDADSSVRYKLTKRQTQEEIQKSTGAVVITRGKYRLPNAPPDGEKPLYLHISAGTHLETTVERIKAVDHAAAIVEEMLKEGSVNNGLKVNPSMSTCVYVGFEAETSLNIAARIRGPNDQYVNHIMNETGATVVLRGDGSGDSEPVQGEDGHQPLHLFLSSNNPKSLERAKLLAENLLDTIAAEFGTSRVSSSKVYGAVPPPPQLLAGSKSLGNELEANNFQAANLNAASTGVSVPAVPTVTAPGMDSNVSQGIVSQSLGSLNALPSQPNMNYYPHMPISSGTSYMGYGGIYPQVTPLQQVALALRQSTSVTAAVSPETTAVNTKPPASTISSIQKEERPAHKRKFRELPATGKGTANPHQLQDLQPPKPRDLNTDAGARDNTVVPAKLCQPSSSVMPPPPPPPKVMPLAPPPPPKFNSPTPEVHGKNNSPPKPSSEIFPDTLVKLMEYGDDDDDVDDIEHAAGAEPLQLQSKSNVPAGPKPFWAV
ncbi:protein RIK isoform X1 [Ipomoea triloba]|uniref:protein RIK isoform X1 n=1 Tax=Ipomoea triloba TaxID=35885 RepID=UPI00125D5A54|nr:protein RIK isoform X1 [Ipomoea triloba]